MTRLDEAARRLERSVSRLEAAVEDAADLDKGDQASSVSSDEHAQLQEVAAAVSARLDDVIGRLERVLEG